MCYMLFKQHFLRYGYGAAIRYGQIHVTMKALKNLKMVWFLYARPWNPRGLCSWTIPGAYSAFNVTCIDIDSYLHQKAIF